MPPVRGLSDTPAVTEVERAMTEAYGVDLLPMELAMRLKQHRSSLLADWLQRLAVIPVPVADGEAETIAVAAPLLDAYLEALERGSPDPLRASTLTLMQQGRDRRELHAVIAMLLSLRDVLTHALHVWFREDPRSAGLDHHEPAVSHLATAVAVAIIADRETVVLEEQEALRRQLSTPLLQVRERLFILPLIGAIDPRRARQLTEQVLRGVRTHRARVVVIDMTGVPTLDASAAAHLVQTVDAARLLGAMVIVSGLSADVAHLLVSLGVDFGRVHTVSDLQAALEEADREIACRPSPGKGGARPG